MSRSPPAVAGLIGDDCTRTILVETKRGARSAAALSEQTGVSEPTIYRRLDRLVAYRNNFDPVPSERDLLSWNDDSQPMIEETRNSRDAALIAVQFEAGLRGGELFELRVGDVFDSTHSMGVHVDGTEGERAVHLIVAVPHLQRWLSEHPTGNDDDWLWSKLSKRERPSYNTWLGYFKTAADRAGVSKDVTPTNFRKSNMRWLVLRDLSQPEIEDRQERVRGSDQTARYMANVGANSLERQYAQAHGREGETADQQEVAPVTCPRCSEETPRDLDFCMHCSQSLDLSTKELLDEVKSRFDDRLVDDHVRRVVAVRLDNERVRCV